LRKVRGRGAENAEVEKEEWKMQEQIAKVENAGAITRGIGQKRCHKIPVL